MNESQILEEIKDFFCIEELVDPITFEKFGSSSWMFIDIRLLETLLILRKNIDKSISINNWKWNGSFQERGLRSNIKHILYNKTINKKLYLSAHIMGKGIDFDVEAMTAEEVRNWIIENEDLFPYKIRLEHKFHKTGKVISWVHLDVFYLKSNPKIYLFNV
jgi:hypothetical protein